MKRNFIFDGTVVLLVVAMGVYLFGSVFEKEVVQGIATGLAVLAVVGVVACLVVTIIAIRKDEKELRKRGIYN